MSKKTKTKKLFSTNERPFSEKSLQFLKKAGKQKSLTWLVSKQSEYELVLRDPLRAYAAELKEEFGIRAKGYHFPQQGIGRIKRPSHRIAAGEAVYKDWLSYMVSKPSKSRFEKNPILFLGLLPNDPEWSDVVIAAGLFQTSSQQMSRIRYAISENSKPFKELFNDKDFKKSFKAGFSEKFTAVRTPRGYDPEHPDIGWIKLKSFFVTKPLTIKQFSSKNLVKNLVKDYTQALRLNSLLEKAIEGKWS